MLKYIIALSIICFCDSAPRMTHVKRTTKIPRFWAGLNQIKYRQKFDTYYSRTQLDNKVNKLIFIQRSPITALRSLKQKLQNEGRTSQEADAYLRQKAGALISVDPGRWILYGLMALNSTGSFVQNCKDASGNSRVYDATSLSENFKKELKTYWPSSMNIGEERVWKLYYDTHGSCINYSPLEYFENAITLYRTHNVGEILRKAGINPGKEYTYYKIVSDIARALNVLPYVKYESFKDGYYLQEVHLCLNIAYKLISCYYGSSNYTSPETMIHYPDRLYDEI